MKTLLLGINAKYIHPNLAIRLLKANTTYDVDIKEFNIKDKSDEIYQYIKENNIPIASVYGEVISQDGKLTLTGVPRTGCVYCAYGCQQEDANNNRFIKLKQTHPQLHKYCIESLGMGDVLDYMNINY